MSCATFAVRETAATPYRAFRSAIVDSSSADVRAPAYDEVASLHSGAIPPTAATNRTDADADALVELGDKIATLGAHIHAATHQQLVLIAEFDRRRGWEADGQQSCAHWLAYRTRIDLGTAREQVRAARALERLPLTSAAMARGHLSFSQLRALSRVAQPETEGDLLALACGATTEQLERMVRAWKKGSRANEAAAERERYESRTLSVFPDDDGMCVIRGRLTPEVGALLMRAIEAAGDALYRERNAALSADTQREAAQRRADAIGLLAERALAAGLGSPAQVGDIRAAGHTGDTGHACARAVDTLPEVPISGTRAQRYQVVLHVEPATLSADGEPGRTELEDGTAVSAETCRRLACDASVVKVTHASDGSVLDVGRKTRTISPALRRALDVRDRGCRFPGCGLRFTDAHHVRHWADGGETSLANCLLLCSYHHTLVHEGGWRVEWYGRARPLFIDPRGQTHFDGGWQPPQLDPCPVDSLIEEHRRMGVTPDAMTAGARWKRERDIPAEIYFRASEAL